MTAQGSPCKVLLGDGFPSPSPQAGGFHLPPPLPLPLTPVPNTEAGRASLRLQASPSAVPEDARGLGLRVEGARGCEMGPPNTRSGRRGSTGVPDEAGPPRASVATRSCQALSPRAGYLTFLCGGRGGASRLPGWEGGLPTPRNSQILPKTKIAGIQLGTPHRAPPPHPHVRCVFLQPGFLTPAPLR